jgi:hypothetical protein
MKKLNPYRCSMDYSIYEKWNNYFEGIKFHTNGPQALAFLTGDNNNTLLLCNIVEEQEEQIKNLKLELEASKSNNIWLEKAMIYKSRLEELNKIMAEDLNPNTDSTSNTDDFYIKYTN